MPLTQQEVLRLKEDAAVNNEIYTSMLNRVQQLRIVRAGEVGNVRIVDFARATPMPSKPTPLKPILSSFRITLLIICLQR